MAGALCLFVYKTGFFPIQDNPKTLDLSYKMDCRYSRTSMARTLSSSNEYKQYTVSQYKKENNLKLSQICNYGICSKGLKNEFEQAVVNEPSVFEPLKFYCIWDCFGRGKPIYSRIAQGWFRYMYFVSLYTSADKKG